METASALTRLKIEPRKNITNQILIAQKHNQRNTTITTLTN